MIATLVVVVGLLVAFVLGKIYGGRVQAKAASVVAAIKAKVVAVVAAVKTRVLAVIAKVRLLI